MIGFPLQPRIFQHRFTPLPAELFAARGGPVEIGFVGEKVSCIQRQCCRQMLATIAVDRLQRSFEFLDINRGD